MLYSAADFLLNTLFGILTMMFLFRFFMQLFRVSFNNPLGQMAIALTDFAVKPTRKLVPSIGKIDLSTLLLAALCQLLLQLILFSLHGLFSLGFPLPAFLLASGLGMFRAILDLFFYAILLQCILSWVNPYTPISNVINQFTRPLLAPIQRIVPPVNGIDFSPVVALILIQLFNIAILGLLSRSPMSLF